MSSILPISEAQFQRRIMDAAKWNRWKVVHIRAVEISKGRWSVPYEGDRGLPDLVMAKDGRIIVPEIKREGGKATKDQVSWLDNLGDHGRLWYPSDWDDILDELMS